MCQCKWLRVSYSTLSVVHTLQYSCVVCHIYCITYGISLLIHIQDLEPTQRAEPAKPQTPEPESEEQREQKAKLQRKEQALQQKDQGNAAYKAKRFDEAIGHYDKAYELYDEDISFITNRWDTKLQWPTGLLSE